MKDPGRQITDPYYEEHHQLRNPRGSGSNKMQRAFNFTLEPSLEHSINGSDQRAIRVGFVPLNVQIEARPTIACDLCTVANSSQEQV